MRECQNCGNHVSEQFARVFSIDGTVRACIECKTNRQVLDVAVAGKDTEDSRAVKQ